WMIYMGMQGSGSIIIDSLVVKEGRPLTEVAAAMPDATPVSNVPAGVTEATGFTPFTIDPPAPGNVTTLPMEGVLTPDGATRVSDEVAQSNYLAFQKLIDQAKATPGTKAIVIPKGVYRFANKAAFKLDGLEDITIDGQGSEFIFQRLYKGECFL